MWLFRLVVNQCGICFDWFINFDLWTLEYLVSSLNAFAQIIFYPTSTHLQTFSFWSKLRPAKRLLVFVFEFPLNVSIRLPWPAVENPFCSRTNKHTNTSFWGITELFPHLDFCSAQCNDVCGYSDVYFRLLTLANIWSSGESYRVSLPEVDGCLPFFSQGAKFNDLNLTDWFNHLPLECIFCFFVVRVVFMHLFHI